MTTEKIELGFGIQHFRAAVQIADAGGHPDRVIPKAREWHKKLSVLREAEPAAGQVFDADVRRLCAQTYQECEILIGGGPLEDRFLALASIVETADIVRETTRHLKDEIERTY